MAAGRFTRYQDPVLGRPVMAAGAGPDDIIMVDPAITDCPISGVMAIPAIIIRI